MAKRYPTLLTDLLILLALASVVILLTLRTYSGGSGYIEVRTHEAVYRYTLSADREVSVDGPLGRTDILIRDGRARIVDSACPTKSCTQQRAIASSGEWIACLPNHVLITVVGSDRSGEVDDVAI